MSAQDCKIAALVFRAPEREIVSPEGVEERVTLEVVFRVTLTGGGKYRTYVLNGEELRTSKVHDSLNEAAGGMAMAMIILGGLALDPEQTLATIIKGSDNAKRD